MATLQDPFGGIDTSSSQNIDVRTGIAIPFGASASGGLRKISGANNDTQKIVSALMSAQSENPFQQPVANIEASLFGPIDPQAQAAIRRKLEVVFQSFEQQNRYSLLAETVEFLEGEEGQVVLAFKYHNLESDEIKDIFISPQG